MNIGILGSGDVGRTLGRGFAQGGHRVLLGTRSPEKPELQAWAADTGAQVGTFAEAAAFGEVLVLATRWTGTEAALDMAGRAHFAGKTVLDATNPLDFSGGGPALALGGRDSAGEQVQRWLPEAHIVKAFNGIGNAHMVRPDFPGGPPDLFIAGNDDAAKQTTRTLAEALGWSVIDLGDLTASRYLEGLAMVWILYGFRTGTWNHAFKLLRK